MNVKTQCLTQLLDMETVYNLNLLQNLCFISEMMIFNYTGNCFKYSGNKITEHLADVLCRNIYIIFQYFFDRNS